MQDGCQPLGGVATCLPGVAGDDQFVLHRMFPADQFGHRDLITIGLQLQAALGVGDLTAEFTGMDRMSPQFGERRQSE